MNFKVLISAVYLMFISSTICLSQNKKVVVDEKSIMDTTLIIPAEFNNTLDYMLQSWVIQRANTSNCKSTSDLGLVSDSVYKLRLSKMPCLMEMPYNPTVKSYIDLYTVRKRRQVEYMLGMSSYYFPIFEQVLGANNLPFELKYLSIIE